MVVCSGGRESLSLARARECVRARTQKMKTKVAYNFYVKMHKAKVIIWEGL
jgi:hypothetical protein